MPPLGTLGTSWVAAVPAHTSLPQVKQLLTEGINRPRKGHDAGDHPPITPMRAATEAELGMECPSNTTKGPPHTLKGSGEERARSSIDMVPLDIIIKSLGNLRASSCPLLLVGVAPETEVKCGSAVRAFL